VTLAVKHNAIPRTYNFERIWISDMTSSIPPTCRKVLALQLILGVVFLIWRSRPGLNDPTLGTLEGDSVTPRLDVFVGPSVPSDVGIVEMEDGGMEAELRAFLNVELDGVREAGAIDDRALGDKHQKLGGCGGL
jgi:hypothetical protein